MRKICFFIAACVIWRGPYPAVSPGGAVYDPLMLPTDAEATPVDLTVSDRGRTRDIPVRIYLPTTETAPVVLFSPGLGGSRDGYVYLARGWSLRGYIVVVLQHPGSDDAVWRESGRGNGGRP